MDDKNTSQDIKINTLEVNYLNMSQQIDKLDEKVEKGFTEVLHEIKCYREESDNKYASKLTEKIVYGLVGLILVAFATGLIYLVFN